MATTHSELWKSRLALPAYRVGEAAVYTGVSPQTITSWEKSYNHKPSVVSRRMKREGLSFLQLIEVAVVAAMRDEGVKLDRIRLARDYFAQALSVDYPFARARFKTDGVDILLDYRGPDGKLLKDRLVVANSSGQLLWREMLQRRLREFNYGEDGGVVAWRVNGINSEIIIDPKISFGAPSIGGIMTRAIKNQRILGRSIEEISDDFDILGTQVEEALRFEGLDSKGSSARWLN